MANVPNVPGVPSLSSYSATPIALLIADVAVLIAQFFSPTWGIFLDGEVAIEINSVLRLDYRQDWSIADYPVEQGAFQSYDKVQLPFDLRLRVASGSSGGDRQRMLAELDVLGNSTDLYDIITPEKTYFDVNVAHVDYNRQADRGVGMIVADVWFTEIRVQATAAFSNTQQPAQAGRQNAGNVQTAAPGANLMGTEANFF